MTIATGSMRFYYLKDPAQQSERASVPNTFRIDKYSNGTTFGPCYLGVALLGLKVSSNSWRRVRNFLNSCSANCYITSCIVGGLRRKSGLDHLCVCLQEGQQPNILSKPRVRDQERLDLDVARYPFILQQRRDSCVDRNPCNVSRLYEGKQRPYHSCSR